MSRIRCLTAEMQWNLLHEVWCYVAVGVELDGERLADDLEVRMITDLVGHLGRSGVLGGGYPMT